MSRLGRLCPGSGRVFLTRHDVAQLSQTGWPRIMVQVEFFCSNSFAKENFDHIELLKQDGSLKGVLDI